MKFLSLQACHLSALDLMWLSKANKHTATLTELNLSENSVTSEELTTTCCLLKACRKSLERVHLSFCNFQDQHVDRLVTNLSLISNLKFVDLRFNMFNDSQLICEKFAGLASHPTLETLEMSVPRILQAFGEREAFEVEFRENFVQLMMDKKAEHRRKPISVIFW